MPSDLLQRTRSADPTRGAPYQSLIKVLLDQGIRRLERPRSEVAVGNQSPKRRRILAHVGGRRVIGRVTGGLPIAEEQWLRDTWDSRPYLFNRSRPSCPVVGHRRTGGSPSGERPGCPSSAGRVARGRSTKARFFVLALFILLDSTVPQFVGSHLLHDTPIPGDPLASTVRGSIVIQLLETLITVVPVVVVVWFSGGSLRAIYFRWGRFGRAYIIGIVGFVAFYLLTARVLSHTQFMPVHGTVSISRYLALTPGSFPGRGGQRLHGGITVPRALDVETEHRVRPPTCRPRCRRLCLPRGTPVCRTRPSSWCFLCLWSLTWASRGYLTRSSDGIVAPSIFHAGVDIPIYQGGSWRMPLRKRVPIFAEGSR